MLNGLDLFSGIGGLTIALEDWVKPIAYCENDRYAQAVLLSRMGDRAIYRAPIWDDVTSLNGSMLPSVDIIYGGFPCQDISLAGVGRGLEGERSKLFYEVTRLVGELRPSFVFLENVAAIVIRGLGDVLGAFTELGYDCRWQINRASDFGAPHYRARWWLLAYSLRERQQNAGSAADLEEQKRLFCPTISGFQGEVWNDVNAELCRVFDGVSPKSHRIKGLGNAVVPRQAREAFIRLMGLNI